MSAEQRTVEGLCQTYLTHLRAWAEQRALAPEAEAQMRLIERRAGIVEAEKQAFRAEMMNVVLALTLEGRAFDHRMHDQLHRALALESLAGERGAGLRADR